MSVPQVQLDLDYTLEQQVHAHARANLSVRRAGAGATAIDAADARPRGRHQHGGIHFRLPGFDLESWKAKKHLKAADIECQPDLNEDLGAPMVWGTQQQPDTALRWCDAIDDFWARIRTQRDIREIRSRR